jgi:hypothetical protein
MTGATGISPLFRSAGAPIPTLIASAFLSATIHAPCRHGLLSIVVCILYPVFIAGTKNLRGRYTPNVRDPGLKAGADFVFDVPEDHTAMIVVFTGRATIEGRPGAGEAEGTLPARCGPYLKVPARSDGDRPP